MKSDATMRVLIVEPGKAPREAVIAHTLEAMQAVVGGPIQAVYPFEEPVALICNDESKSLGLPWNRMLRDSSGKSMTSSLAHSFSAPPQKTASLLRG